MFETYTHTHTRLTALWRDYPGEPVPEKVKPIWILLKQETVSGSGISWAICKSAPRSSQITTPAPHHSVFYRPDAFLPPNQQRQSSNTRCKKSNLTLCNIILTCSKEILPFCWVVASCQVVKYRSFEFKDDWRISLRWSQRLRQQFLQQWCHYRDGRVLLSSHALHLFAQQLQDTV